MMINVKLNDEIILLEGSQSLAELLFSQGHIDLHFAVAINRRFVPRLSHSSTILQDGDIIEMITPMQGG